MARLQLNELVNVSSLLGVGGREDVLCKGDESIVRTVH